MVSSTPSMFSVRSLSAHPARLKGGRPSPSRGGWQPAARASPASNNCGGCEAVDAGRHRFAQSCIERCASPIGTPIPLPSALACTCKLKLIAQMLLRTRFQAVQSFKPILRQRDPFGKAFVQAHAPAASGHWPWTLVVVWLADAPWVVPPAWLLVLSDVVLWTTDAPPRPPPC